MSRILVDIRYSARGFARRPGLTLALLLTIAVGIGSNVVVHGFIRGLIVSADTEITPERADGLSRVAMVLNIATGAVFFIACGNVASFLLGRASARTHETSLRIALGASRRQLARQLLSDSVLISLTGGALGLLLAMWTWRIVPVLFFEQDAEHLAFAPDLYSIVASSALCIGITMVCGLVPLFEIHHDRPAAVLRRESSAPSKVMRRLRAMLVIAQMTCCCVLMTSTGLLSEGLRRGLQTSAGHRLAQSTFARVQAHPDLVSKYLHLQYFKDVEHAAQSLAGVSGTALAERLPGNRPRWQTLRVEPPQPALRDVMIDVATFNADSPSLFTLPRLAGRTFSGGDTTQTCRAAIVNEEAAEELFDGDAVGRAIEDSRGERVDIIGVVASRKTERAGRQSPIIYFYGNQDSGPSVHPVGGEQFRVPAVSKLSKAELDANVVSPGYFETMGLSLITGRIPADDPRTRRCRTGVINREAAELYFGGNAIGAAVIDEAGRRTEIIGVVDSAPLGVFQPRVDPAIYYQMAWDSPPEMTLIVRTNVANDTMLDAVRRRIEAVPGRGPDPVVVKTLETHFNQTALAPLRIATVIAGGSTAMAVALSILGLYAALTDAARQRGRELAVRVALGARRRHVIGQVLIEGGRLATAGAGAGILGSFLLSRWLAKIIPGGAPAVWVWLAAPLVLAGAVAVASVLPVRRALMVDPLRMMRDGN